MTAESEETLQSSLGLLVVNKRINNAFILQTLINTHKFSFHCGNRTTENENRLLLKAVKISCNNSAPHVLWKHSPPQSCTCEDVLHMTFKIRTLLQNQQLKSPQKQHTHKLFLLCF